MTLFQPIAAASGIADENAAKYHRNWLIVDDADNWLDDKDLNKLSELDISLKFGYLVIRAQGMLRLDVPLDVIEDDSSVERTANINGHSVRVVDEGDLASAWFSQWAGIPCKLVKIHPGSEDFSWGA